MGQKTHPYGFRLGVIKTWTSKWFEDKNYTKWLHEDVRIKRAAARPVEKLIKSAVANATDKSKGQVDVDTLYVSRASVDKGPNSHMRRWRPRAQGRATRIEKGVSHIQIELDQR